MLTVERMVEIDNLLKQNGSVRVDQLALRFGVSEMTIRRDLEKMEKENMLVRCHGGAVAKAEITKDQRYDNRVSLNVDAKASIARYCFEHFVRENEVIYLDAGSTALELAKLLVSVPGLTVVTNDVIIAGTLINSNVDVFMLGGSMQRSLGCIHGHTAESQLENYRVDVAFVSSLCVDDQFDVFAATESKVYFRRKVMNCANQTYMMMDESKFYCRSLFRINNLSEYTALITNKPMPETAKQAGLKWITV